MNSGKPKYLADKLLQRQEGRDLRGRLGSIHMPNKNLSISKESFLYRGACLLNKLGDNLRNEKRLEIFKTGMKKWAKANIQTKPTSRHPQLTQRIPVQPQPRAQPRPQIATNANDIRQFLIPQGSPHGVPPDRQPPTDRPTPTDRPPPPAKSSQPAVPEEHQHMNRITRYFQPSRRQESEQRNNFR